MTERESEEECVWETWLVEAFAVITAHEILMRPVWVILLIKRNFADSSRTSFVCQKYSQSVKYLRAKKFNKHWQNGNFMVAKFFIAFYDGNEEWPNCLMNF